LPSASVVELALGVEEDVGVGEVAAGGVMGVVIFKLQWKILRA
jgi:hypothetical protein